MMIATLVLAAIVQPGAQGGPIEVTDDNWGALRDQVIAKGPDLGFREIKWQSNHWAGPGDAIRKAAPILLWTTSGHPLGLTSSFGISSRLNVWGDPSLQVQAGFFAPVADDLQRMVYAENWLPKSFKDALQSKTGEGIYVLAPGGVVLGNTSSTDPSTVSRMLDDALAKWAQIPAGSRSWAKDKEVGDRTNPFKPMTPPVANRPGSLRPSNNRTAAGEKGAPAEILAAPGSRDGVQKLEEKPARGQTTATGQATTTTPVKPARTAEAAPAGPSVAKLKLTIRDLPRDGKPQRAHNYLFFNLSDRVGPLVSTEAKPNSTVNWPKKMVQSLASSVFLDSVKGIPLSFSEGDVQTARISSTISNITGDVYTLRLVGNTNASASGYWALEPGKQANEDTQQVRGMDIAWLGRAKWDAKKKQFLSLEMVGAGQRWGGSPLNGRLGDTQSQPIGLYITMVSTAWYDQIEPSSLESQKTW